MDNVTELKIGIGADLTQLEADLKSAEKKIADVGNTPVKVAVTPDIDAKAFVAAVQREVAKQAPVKVKVNPTPTTPTGGTAGAATQAAQQQTAAAKQTQAAQRVAAQEQMAYERAIQQLRSMSMSSYQRQQERITEILKKQLDYVNRRIDTERSAPAANKHVVAALQLEKATLKTTAHTARLSIYAKDLAAYMNKAKNSMSGFQGYARSTANIFKGIILSQAFYRGLDAIKSTLSDAWELSKALNTAEATFSGMLVGGQKKAQGLLEVLKQEAISTPFDIKNLTQATRLLTAYGIQAENVLFVLHGIEQAVAASGDASKMENISRALGQIYTKGKLMGEEVRQLTEAGIAVSDILSEELGLTQEELSKGWAKLNIDANTAINAIVRGIDKRYGKALENMAKTTEQKINNMRESFALIASSLTDPIRRAVDSVIDMITPKLEYMYQAIQAVGLGNALKSLLPPSIFNGAIAAIDKVVRAAQAIKIVFNQIKPVISAVLNALAWYGNTVYNVFISVISAIGMFGKAIGASANGAAMLETGLKRVLGALLAYKAAMLVVGAVSRIWSVVSFVLRGVMLTIQGAIVYTKLLAAAMSAAGAAGAAGFVPIVGVLLVIIGLVAALAGSLGSVIDAAKRVGTALKNLGGGTNIGDMFKDMSGGLQESIDAYNAEVAKQNEEFSHELKENSDKQTDDADEAAGATKKAMQGLMSFDEVYKLNEPAGGADITPVEIEEMPPIDFGGAFDGVGGLGDDLFKDLDLSELQDALGDLWGEVYPLLDEILLYGAKMLMYFKEMQLYSKLMTDESKEQSLQEKSQTSEDKEQALQEKSQTSEDKEQALQEKAQTSEDKEQALQEKAQTSEDKEQLLHEQAQTSQDKEQLLHEQAQTTQDKEQLLYEQAQTTQDKEQLLQEQSQTMQDKEQGLTTRTGGVAGGIGSKGTAAALGLINLAQLATDAKLISDDIKDLREDGATVNEWMSLFVDGLMAAVDALGLFLAGKMLFGAGKAVAGSVGKAAAAGAAGAGAAPSVDINTNTVDTLNQSTGQLNPKLLSLAKNLGMGLVVIAEVAAAALLITGAIWALGKILEEVGKAWEPVIENAGTIAIAMGIGTALLAAIGAVAALLGSVGTGLIVNMGIGIAVLAEIGIATGLFLAEIWGIGKGLDEIGKAWQPVLDNGDTITKAIALGTGLLVAVGVVCAALGMATVATAGALPLAIGLGTGILVELAIAFIALTESLVAVADELSGNLAPALSRLNEKLPDLSSDMGDFVGFMTEFAEHVVEYTKASVISGLAATVDTIIGWFTKDPLEKLASDIANIYSQTLRLNEKLRLANPELKSAIELLTDYQTFMSEMSEIMNSSSNTALPDQIFVNLQEVGKKLITGFGQGISDNAYVAKTAMETACNEILATEQLINGTSGSTSTVYTDEGKKVVTGLADGIKNNTPLATNSFKSLLNSMLPLMEKFTKNIASALNSMLSKFASTMKSMSVSSSGNVSYKSMSGVSISRLADGGIIQAKNGIQLVKKPTMVASNVQAGEAGTEVVFPLENTGFIKSFAEDIAKAVGNLNMQQSAQNINVQMEQARAGATQAVSISTASAKEISDAIKSWFTPQMQSLHDVLEEDRSIDVTVPPTSNAMMRMFLSELKAVNSGSGSRGFSIA